jgi:two-component system, LuxR family, response regulator FixJ
MAAHNVSAVALNRSVAADAAPGLARDRKSLSRRALAANRLCLHVIDPEARRREQVCRYLDGFHGEVEVDTNLEQFGQALPDHGAILAFDDSSPQPAQGLFELMRRGGRILPIALYSDCATIPRVVQAMRDGAADYLQWPFDPQIVSNSLELLAHESGRVRDEQRRELAARSAIDKLSPREKDVLWELVEGGTNKVIGWRLGISERTVEIHRGNLMRKLNVRLATEAVKLALRAGLDVRSRPHIDTRFHGAGATSGPR